MTSVLPQLGALSLDGPKEPTFVASDYRDTKKEYKPLIDKDAIKKAIFQTDYEPSIELWESNQRSYVQPAKAEDAIPEGYPELSVDPSVWDGKVLINEPEKWLHKFTQAEIADVNSAIKHFQSLKLDFNLISRDTFPLSTLKPVLEKAVQEIHYGLGLRVMRGLPVNDWTREEQIIAFAGIAAWIGNKRLTQGGATAIVHLRDITHLDPEDRPAIVVKGQTSGNQVFHTDAGDIVGLITLNKAAKGGLSQLSSVGQTYNYFSQNRRDILRTMAGKWYPRHSGLEGTPLIHHVNNRVLAQYSRRVFFTFFEDQHRPENLPPLTPEQHLALDAIHYTAEKFSLDIDLEPGDLEFFNNLTLFHARDGSEDSPEQTRHLMRIWVRNQEHALDHGEVLDKRWNDLYPKEGVEQGWPLEAWDKRERTA